MERIAELSVLTLRAPLPEVINFGDWVMRHREFVLVHCARRARQGFGFTLTREAPIAAAIRQAVAHHYIGASIGSVEEIAAVFRRCQGSNLASLASGSGLRALSIVDLAAYDLLAKTSGISIARLLGGTLTSLPATAIIGYPPATMGPGEVRAQVESLRAAGWRRFKIPIALPLEYGAARLLAAREAAGADAWLGMDAAWVFRAVEDALAFLDPVGEAGLAWFEDVFPPGDATLVAALREALTSHRDGRRAGELLPRGVACQERGGCHSDRLDMHGRNHLRPRPDRGVRPSRDRVCAAHVRACA